MTAGESHGPGLTVVVSGVPAGLELDREAIRRDLARRQAGYGRSPRQKLEQDDAEVTAGVRHGRTLGSPIAMFIQNRDHRNWTHPMSAWPVTDEALEEYGWRGKPMSLPRPGHADLPGVAQVRPRGRPQRARAGQRPRDRGPGGGRRRGQGASSGAIGIEVRSHVLQVGSVRATAPGLALDRRLRAGRARARCAASTRARRGR